MYWCPNFLAVVFKKQEISQQVVTRMQDLASEFSKTFRGHTAATSQREEATPSRTNTQPGIWLGAGRTVLGPKPWSPQLFSRGCAPGIKWKILRTPAWRSLWPLRQVLRQTLPSGSICSKHSIYPSRRSTWSHARLLSPPAVTHINQRYTEHMISYNECIVSYRIVYSCNKFRLTNRNESTWS